MASLPFTDLQSRPIEFLDLIRPSCSCHLSVERKSGIAHAVICGSTSATFYRTIITSWSFAFTQLGYGLHKPS